MFSRHLLASLCVLTIMIQREVAQATTTVAQTWQQMAQEADFIGVVKCVTAGGIVARYKVEESWKGLANGSELLMRRPVDVYGDQYPTLLCGDRMLVMAYKTSTSGFGDSGSLFWTMPADYGAILFGAWGLESERGFEQSFGPSVNTFKKVKLLVRRFLAASDGEQERDVILSLAIGGHRWFLFIKGNPPNPLRPRTISREERANAYLMIESLQNYPDVSSLVQEMIRMVQEDEVSGVLELLREAGGQVTLDQLNASNHEAWPEGALRSLQHTKEQIARRLEAITSDYPKPKVGGAGLGRENLAEARRVVDFYWAGKGREPFAPKEKLDSSSCIQLLAAHNPDFLSDKLLAWSRTDDRPMNDWTYGLVRDFCWNCASGREAQFTKLQKAQDPFVRVMAAIYLCFENKESGLLHLRACSQLPGDEGAWAALTLARRGDKVALSRALQVFSPDEVAERATYNRTNVHYILQQRLMILLSNSAQAGGLPVPPSFDNYSNYYRESQAGKEARSLHLRVLEKWWAEHSDVILLHDPWLDMLEKAKRD